MNYHFNDLERKDRQSNYESELYYTSRISQNIHLLLLSQFCPLNTYKQIKEEEEQYSVCIDCKKIGHR